MATFKIRGPVTESQVGFSCEKWFGQWNKQHARKRLFHTQNNNKKKLFRYSGSAWPRTHSQCVREDMYFFTHEKIRDEREGEVLTEVWNLVTWTKSSYFPSRTLLQLYNFYWKGGKLWHNYKRSWYHFSLDNPFVFPLNIKPTCCSAICILCSSRARSCSVVLSTMLLPPTSNLLSIIYGERGSSVRCS